MRSLVWSHRSLIKNMAIYKIKRFSFMENLKGNPKIKEAFLAWNKNKIDPEIGSDPLLKNVPKELKSYITFLYEHVPTDEKGVGPKPLFLMSYEKVMEQFEKGKTPFDYRRIGESRIILCTSIDFADHYDIIAYYPGDNTIKTSNEPSRLDLIGRLSNRIGNAILKTENIKSTYPVSDLFTLIRANI